MKLLKDILQGALIGALTLALAMLIAMKGARAAEVEWFAGYQHTSDLFRGAPFNHKNEPTHEYLHGGFTIAAGKRRAWEIDLSHGVKGIDCAPKNCSWEQGSQLGVRFYSLRGRMK